jgi:lipid-binding SYLF domain-containing protein
MTTRRNALAAIFGAAMLGAVADRPAIAATAAEIDAEVRLALDRLYRESPAARNLAETAKGVLVFPNIVKGGLIIGGQYGEGALRRGGRTVGYYNTVAASWGLQAGAERYSQAIFFMTDEALRYLDQSRGFEIGVDATVAVANVGAGGDLTSSTLQSPIIAFVFGEQGLMAGISIEGSKVTRIER